MSELPTKDQPLIISSSGVILITITPFGTNQIISSPLLVDQAYQLSRFAYFHNYNGQMVLESPLAHCQIVLHNLQVLAILQLLTTPQTLTQLIESFSDISQDILTILLSWLLGEKFLTAIDKDGLPQEEQSLQLWEFHDLLFHTRSRLGRHDYPYGNSNLYIDKIAPLPAVKPRGALAKIDLYRPDIDILIAQDLPFTRVLEERQSQRRHGQPPITSKQLGEFLYRTARVRSLKVNEATNYELSDRPYPNGGACYELEIYLVINACEGIESGLYHYCPQAHLLEQVNDYNLEVYKLSCQAATESGLPQVLIILAARFPRVSWKYRSLAYALILKHVGVLYQNMYLVATAMDLAACAIGGGDSDLFAQVTGCDYLAETSIGEFIIGSKVN
jgi:oxazoline/thiazoline dehydrogenase